MSTGAMINHGVSGYACTGFGSEYQDQLRGTPWDVTPNDPILSYANAQNHLGLMMSNFNEAWAPGILSEENISAQPYRTPIVGNTSAPPPRPTTTIPVAEFQYPDHTLQQYPQQLPSTRIHGDYVLNVENRQNNTFESGQITNEHQELYPQGNVSAMPNSYFFQGARTDPGVHPNNDVANQSTTANTTRSDFTSGQAPTQKLPNGINISIMQPNEPPALWNLAPPPDPPVRPQEGTGQLKPTNPAWW